MQFSGKEFIVQSQSSRDGLQSSSFTKSPAVRQAPLLGTPTHTLPVFSATKTGAVDITWNPPSGGVSEIQTLLCEVIDSSKNPLLTQSIGKPIPGTVPIDVKELVAKAVPNSKLQFRAAYTPSSNNIANSGYSVDSTSFEILSAPTEFSVTYVESKLSGVLSISWLPQSDTDEYQVQFVDTASKNVVVSREFNNTHHAHKTTGKHLSSYKLLPSDMNKLQPGHNYSVEIYSLGNDTSFLFSVTPTVLPSVVHYLSEVKKLSAVYNEETDKITITFSQVPNAKKYKFYVLTQPKTAPPTKAVVVATFSFPAPKKAASDKDKKNTQPQELKFSKSVAEFRDKLLPLCQYSLEVRAFGETVDVGSKPTQAPQTWVLLEPPTNVSCTYSPKYPDDTLTVVCEAVPHVSSYTLAVSNIQDQHLTVSPTVHGSKSLSTVFKGKAIKGKGGDKFECLARSKGKSGAFNSHWTKSSTILERLATPTASNVTYGSDVTEITLTYSTVSNSQSYFVQLIPRDGGSEKDFPEQKPKAGAKYVEVKVPVDDASSLKPYSELTVKATAIAHKSTNFINSVPGLYVSPPIRIMDSPQKFIALYQIHTGTMSLKWSPVKDCGAYSIQLLQMPSTIVHHIDNITENVYDSYPVLNHLSLSKHYTMAVIAHSTDPHVPVLPGAPTRVPTGEEWIVDNVISNLKIETSEGSAHIVLTWDLSSKYTTTDIVMAVLVYKGKESTNKLLTPPNGSSLCDLNVSPGVKYKFKILSMASQKCPSPPFSPGPFGAPVFPFYPSLPYVIGLPLTKEFVMGKNTSVHMQTLHACYIVLSKNNNYIDTIMFKSYLELKHNDVIRRTAP